MCIGGACFLSKDEEQPLAEGPADLEPPRMSPGRLDEMDSLRPEKEQWHKSQHWCIRLRRETHHCTGFRKKFTCWPDQSQQQCVQTGTQPQHGTNFGKSLRQPSNLAKHWCVHARDKPHQCSECEKSFREVCNFTRPQFIHTGVKLHQCSECGKTFNQSSKLTQHQLIHRGVQRSEEVHRGKPPEWFVSRAYLQLEPGDVMKRSHLAKLKTSPRSTGGGALSAGGAAGNRRVEHVHLPWPASLPAVEGAEDLRAGEDW
ncbi:zinc finger protein 551-like [Alligator sinensis]|uniref:Zinc finger protein 551-like n=1 Tax=Alligator sinensis TaxID=38654 RepID=A0A3Q0FWA9_ALLSI|nr:zinc finger protein 551-like [Alligator sinensis]